MHRPLICFLLVGLFVFPAGAFGYTSPVRQAVELYNQGRFESAILKFHIAKPSELSPASFYIWGMCAYKSGKYYSAGLKFLKSAAHGGSESANTFSLAAESFLEAGQYDLAISAFKQIKTDKLADRQKTWFFWGEALYYSGQYKEAIEKYKMALDGNNKNISFSSYVGLARGYIKTGNRKLATKSAKSAKEMTGDNGRRVMLVGELMLDLGLFDKAIELLTRSVDMGMESMQVHYNLASAYSARGEVKKACEELRLSVDRGFKDFAGARRDRQMENVVSEKCFRELSGKN